MNRITIDDDVEARVRAAFDEMIPKLIDSASATTLDRRIADDHDPLIVLGQPQRSRARLAAAVFATAAAIVGLLAITNRPSLDAPAAAPAPTPSSATNSWFDVLRVA